MQLHRFLDTKALNQHFVRELTRILQKAIAARGKAFLVVSGGKTPVGLFQMLSKTNEIDWKKVTVTLADERWVDPAQEDSNENLVKKHLLQNQAECAQFVSLFSSENSIAEGINIINERLQSLPVFDIVILGMGEDGHTASLFPCSEEIHKALAEQKPATVITPKTASYRRISLTPSRLLNSRHVFLHLVGESKLEVLNQAMSGDEVLQMPVRTFLHHPTVDVQVMFAS
ncbi:6-phosphogluconolactonase [Legionella israelensis]|uniref:6-phosphogluconolactonase n=1 Tax=Legionella israelensis TaxID=454 RepID=A0A0W0W3S4_9GAMM|nr:6-phosphogluconolactonase [Legionella israelensis]KTD26921.1 6-phosphogluconolactonase [Legionella israelensis]QBS08585.1 6-phosphogluconolactonase [Legionella israelensis]SCX75764.1 6-phosphogluconolactonase [Legionella israelensis DSM 19235]STX58239.1 6-phosphogluconolactonase [Legionella israelensis]